MKFATKSSTTIAALARAAANCGPAPPPLTALRNAMNFSSAAMIELKETL